MSCRVSTLTDMDSKDFVKISHAASFNVILV